MVRRRPLIVVWSILAAIGGVSLARSTSPVDGSAIYLAIGCAWSALVFAGIRTQALLQTAVTKSQLGHNVKSESSPEGEREHSVARLLPAAIVAGGVIGLGVGAALVGLRLFLPPNWVVLVGCTLTTPLLCLLALRLFSGDLNRRCRPRKTTLFRWVVLDTALPAALICAPFTAGFAWLRLRGVVDVEPLTLARHFALTFVIWGLCVGTAAFMKTRRERSRGLVDAPFATWVVPSPAALGGIFAILVLVIAPRVIPAVSLETLVVVKGALGFFVGGIFSALGAIRGAHDPSEGDPKAR